MAATREAGLLNEVGADAGESVLREAALQGGEGLVWVADIQLTLCRDLLRLGVAVPVSPGLPMVRGYVLSCQNTNDFLFHRIKDTATRHSTQILYLGET